MGSKRCTKCNRVKALSSFYVDNNRVDKRQGRCKVCVLAVVKQFRIDNPTYHKEYDSTHAEERAEYSKNWKKKNYKSYRAYQRGLYKHKMHTDIAFKITHQLGCRIRRALKGKLKAAPTMQLVGCTAKQLKVHLEAKFTERMNWDNHGLFGWHVDHIYPLSRVDLLDPVEQSIYFHFSNLQPLWAEDNYKKSDKILEGVK